MLKFLDFRKHSRFKFHESENYVDISLVITINSVFSKFERNFKFWKKFNFFATESFIFFK